MEYFPQIFRMGHCRTGIKLIGNEIFTEKWNYQRDYGREFPSYSWVSIKLVSPKANYKDRIWELLYNYYCRSVRTSFFWLENNFNYRSVDFFSGVHVADLMEL